MVIHTNMRTVLIFCLFTLFFVNACKPREPKQKHHDDNVKHHHHHYDNSPEDPGSPEQSDYSRNKPSSESDPKPRRKPAKPAASPSASEQGQEDTMEDNDSLDDDLENDEDRSEDLSDDNHVWSDIRPAKNPIEKKSKHRSPGTGGIHYIGEVKNVMTSGIMTNSWNIKEKSDKRKLKKEEKRKREEKYERRKKDKRNENKMLSDKEKKKKKKEKKKKEKKKMEKLRNKKMPLNSIKQGNENKVPHSQKVADGTRNLCIIINDILCVSP